MIVCLKSGADADSVRRELTRLGLWPVLCEGDSGAVCFRVEPCSAQIDPRRIEEIDGVLETVRPPSAHPLVDAHAGPVRVVDVELGPGRAPVLMAGPCSVESETQIELLAERLAASGARFLRGGAFKPRSSPYAFRGRGLEALSWMRAAADRHGLLVVTEALSEETAAAVAEHADLVQIGSRNMHNYALLERVSSHGRPVLLKRGMAATLEEWLLAAEYCLLHGAAGVVFCERGVRGFDGATRNLLDLATVALMTHVHGHPVVVDPSHSLGRRDLVLPMCRAALAAGAAGLLVEVHEEPARALSDGPQAMPLDAVAPLARAVAEARATPASHLAVRSGADAGPAASVRRKAR